MAAKLIKLGKSLAIKVPVDKDDQGKDIIKKFSFKGVKDATTEQDLFDISKEIEKVLVADVDEILLLTESSIIGA